MSRITQVLFVLCFCLFAMNDLQAQDRGPLRHVVSFKFSDDATEQQINACIKDFAGLKEKISEIKSFEWGTNNSPEGLTKGLTHCFILTFDDEKGRDIYLPHPDHKAFGDAHGKIFADVFVIDYYAKDGM
ncbi:MAG: Dabb family protein [Bacteroidota bacterium]